MPSYFTLHDPPRLRTPVLVAAFQGWNDAAEAASAAVRFMVDAWSAPVVATLDPEEFFDFTQTRPRVRLLDGLHRVIDWPALELFAHADAELERDIVLLVGPEPQLRWRTFVDELLAVVAQLGVRQAVLLGALLADVPHTRPIRITGSTPDEALHRQRLLYLLAANAASGRATSPRCPGAATASCRPRTRRLPQSRRPEAQSRCT